MIKQQQQHTDCILPQIQSTESIQNWVPLEKGSVGSRHSRGGEAAISTSRIYSLEYLLTGVPVDIYTYARITSTCLPAKEAS